MKIVIAQNISIGLKKCKVGEEVEVKNVQAQYLIQRGFATMLEGSPKEIAAPVESLGEKPKATKSKKERRKI
jgi:hypothetical protein